MPDKKDDKTQVPSLPVYECHPPPWLPQIHGAGDLGYPGFHPSRPGQDEDKMTAANVKLGFILPQPVAVDTFSAQSMIKEKLKLGDTLSKLEELMNQVFVQRTEQLPSVPASSFRLPPRVTLNDSKRQAWFADLANPDVPLHKLGKSVPHGAKGHDLLDQLHDNNIAIPRAVWVLRVFGANETAGLRNKPSYNPTQYSVEWANVVTGYLKKQLDVIVLPTAPRPGLTYKHTFKGVLSDANTREQWISKFSYCLKLLRTFYHEGLVDNRTFLVWMVHQMKTCNLAQAGFVTRLVDEYLSDVLTSLALAKPLVEACLNKLSEISSTSAQETLVNTETLLKVILKRLLLAIPDAFVSPRLCLQHGPLMENTLTQDLIQRGPSHDRYLDQNLREIRETTRRNLADVKRRNEALSFRDPPARVSAKLSAAVSNVKLLNSISSDTDISSMVLFEQDNRDPMSFPEKLDMLLTWSVTPLQYGDHRPLAAVTLIRNWRDKACERATRRGQDNPHTFLQDQLFDWLDNSEVAGDSCNIRSVALLYGKLVKFDLFSYPSYIQRLIARGEPGLASGAGEVSRHHHFLRWIPLFNTTPSLIYQRKVTLHGVNARETPEDVVEREIRNELRTVLPYLFSGSTEADSWTSTSELLDACNFFINATRYEQVRTFRQWLLPSFEKVVPKATTDAQRAGVVQAYRVTVELMDYAKCFTSILELTLCMLRNALDSESMISVVDVLHRYSAIWPCMNSIPTIVQALNTAYQSWQAHGLQSRPLLGLLMEFDNGRHLAEASRNQILSDITAFRIALQPVGNHLDTVPEVLPEILQLSTSSDPNAAETLADGMWIKYRMSSNWAARVWSNALASFQQLPRRYIAQRYGVLLWKVDQHLPNGLDEYILQWFYEAGPSQLPLLRPETWRILERVFLSLAIQGALETTTILTGLVYPAWQLASSLEPLEPAQLAYLNAANNICKCLLLKNCPDDGGVPEVHDLFDVQRLRTRRQAVYSEPHFSKLVGSIPLVIYLENLDKLPQDLRTRMSCLRRRLCQDPGFRQGAYRNLEVIREAFESSPYLEGSYGCRRKEAMSGLRLILWDSPDDVENDDWPEVSSLLSPWKLAATTIQMQFQIKQVGRALSQENTHEIASNNLDKLTVMLFHHTKTSEEAYYVGEMTRGADPTVAMKFVKTGLSCTKNLLENAQVDDPSFTNTLNRVGELLRILIHVTTPFREQCTPLPSLDPAIHEQFLEVLRSKISHLGSLIQSSQPSEEFKSNLVLLARLLQFILNFRESSSSPAVRSHCQALADSIFQLVLYYGSGDNIDETIYPLLMDTLIFIYDEIPVDPKALTSDPFKYYPNISPNSLPPSIPTEYRKQILSLLIRSLPPSITSNLVHSYRDPQGNLVFGGPVSNRPWEWVENIGEASPDDEDDRERFQSKHAVRNSGSISLEAFGARLTGDSIVRNLVSLEDPRVDDDLRSFEDGLSSESIYARDWRETRVILNGIEPVTDHIQRMQIGEATSQPFNAGSLRSDNRSTPKGSPAGSVVSRSSGRASSRRHQSPSQASTAHHRLSNSTMGDVIDVDSMSTVGSRRGSGSKRKTTAEDDDDIEIVDGPIPGRGGGGKRARSSKVPAQTATAGKTRTSLRKK
ncbi:hypothetical protein DFP72DRAFT_1031563 [Ephemerocybe angulata]|uniref:Mediator of RNA polymerase II transcription subunit 12 n=1 Tax=Ephemerocybe angulata TaxID=980116 RepID=A0A8H6MCH7_9AGAR|nr:hypothetical protein DFP72DRAFT_1031563 [Tulosesus angulatus]